MDALTLDQLGVFVAIVDEGSFAAAARRIGRAQSAITYAIQKLEDQSQVTLFDRAAYRPTLTEAGRSLLPHARQILADVAQYRVKARAIASGLEAQVNLVVSDALPVPLLTQILHKFHKIFPTVRLHVSSEWPNIALERLDSGAANIAVIVEMTAVPEWFICSPCIQVPLIAVAAPSHPLAQIRGFLSPDILRDYLQIVFVGRKMSVAQPDFGVMAVNRWEVTDITLKHRLLLDGTGWGALPLPLIEDDIRSGRLVKLEPLMWDSNKRMPYLSLLVGSHRDHSLGPAATALINWLQENAIDDLN